MLSMLYRKILLSVVIGFLVIGAYLIFSIFSDSLQPAEHLKRQRVLTVNLEKIEPDTYEIFYWLERPVAVYKTGTKSKEYLLRINESTSSPRYTYETFPKFFAYELLSTYKGCLLSDSSQNKNLVTNYVGWYDPCHMGFWDFSGRNIPGVFTPGEITLPNLKALTSYKWLGGSVVEFSP